MKTCIICNQTEETVSFTKRPAKKKHRCDGCYREQMNYSQAKYRIANKKKIKASAQQYRSKNKEQRKQYDRDWYAKRYSNGGKLEYDLWRKYQLNWERYVQMLKEQDYSCAICKTPFEYSTPHVDHNHKCCPNTSQTCGKCTRGLLCRQCNLGIGSLQDSQEILTHALHYLKAYS